ncbi:hypothetical protein [Streptomyces sp. NPDC005805]|uniref:hypothetical protein n=1 Tax=Streptomyces sp. NPDC005805 TaxID=3157068 RepID=UPI0033E98B5D
MNEFLSAVAGFPTALFSAALVVVLVFWLLVAAGGASQDMFDSDADTAWFGSAGLGGVPVTVAVSLFVVLAWFTSVTGSLLLRGSGLTGVPYAVVACAVLAAAVFVPWRATRRLVRGLAKLFPDEPGPSRQDFIGMTCTIRTGRVDAHFGQAEVRARDGSTAVVQVRQLPGEGPGPDGPSLVAGSTGLLFAFDDDGEFFWVAPFSALGELPDAGHPTAA